MCVNALANMSCDWGGSLIIYKYSQIKFWC
jgi:hypothetical protein